MESQELAVVSSDEESSMPEVGDLVMVTWLDHCACDEWSEVRSNYPLPRMVTVGCLMEVHDDHYVIASTYEVQEDDKVDSVEGVVRHVMVLVRDAVRSIQRIEVAREAT